MWAHNPRRSSFIRDSVEFNKMDEIDDMYIVHLQFKNGTKR